LSDYSAPHFKFKQFAVWHDQCGMKVSTDAVILGAWAGQKSLIDARSNGKSDGEGKSKAWNILDIGTGTGILSLMMAQRFANNGLNKTNISAIELDENAALQARHNFEASPWADMLTVIHQNVKTWASSFSQELKFDTIVCNPPYFSDGPKSLDSDRSNARHDQTFEFSDLLNVTTQVLTASGKLYVVIPASELHRFNYALNSFNERLLKTDKTMDLVHLSITHSLSIKHNDNAEVNRLVLTIESAKTDATKKSTSLIIRNADNSYHDSLKDLCRDYYLKM
jgi:tRNA1Val (adenine37-N6)-methyltransferase